MDNKIGDVSVLVAAEGYYTIPVAEEDIVINIVLSPNSTDVALDFRFNQEGGVLEDVSATSGDEWGTPYAEHTRDITATLISIRIAFNKADMQANTAAITDCPVIATKGSTEHYVTITPADKSVSSVTFYLKEWSNSKKFSTLKIQYTLNGTNWVDSTSVGTGTNTALSALGLETTTVNGATVYVLSASSLPTGVQAVRLVVAATGSNNMQIGIWGADLTVVG